MFKNLVIASIIFWFGLQVGQRMITKEIAIRMVKLNKFQQEIKKQNNQMVENFAQMYAATREDKGEFTEVDAILASMWMD